MTEAVLAGLFGLLIGSFLNVCIYRLPRDLSVVRPRSYCPECEHPIPWYDNIPLVSFLLLGGRCRHCHRRIPFRYPLVELLTGGAFFAAVILHGSTLFAFKLCLFAAILVELIFSDIEERILPDEFTLGGMFAGFILAAVVPMDHGLVYILLTPALGPVAVSVAESVAGAAFTGGALWAVGWLYQKIRHKEGLGLGDVKMVGMIGAFLGLHQTLLTLMVGSLAGSIIGLLYIYGMRKDPATYELPYGSFLGAAALWFALFGRMIFNGVG